VSYAAFLGVFLLLPIVALFAALRRGLRRFHFVSAGLVCLLAFVYTTPWDNYAAYRHLWTFAPNFVLGRPYWVGYLPLEEYLFYFGQAILVCLTTVALARWRVLTPEEDPRQK
jgi:lycopene cyclase domain-containing protein